MTTEEQIAALDKKIEKYRKDDAAKSQGDRYENLSLILYGFALATLSLALVASPPTTGEKLAAVVVSGFATVLFLVLGIVATVKLKNYRRWRDF